MKAFRLPGLIIVLALVLAACAPAVAVVEPVAMPTEAPAVEPEPIIESSNTIVDIAAGNPDFSTLVAAVCATGLVEALSGEGPFTVFAPMKPLLHYQRAHWKTCSYLRTNKP